jgi:hypothetical protein
MDMFRGRGALRHDFRIQMPFKNRPMDGPDPILSVGITGHRSIAAEPIVSEAVEAAISVVLQALGKRGRSCAATKHLATSTRFRLKVVSMLAEGADLLGMQAGLDCGAELVGVLPFDEQAYREAFESAPSQALFDHVWSKLSSIVVLGGFVGDDASYEHANRAILDRSDVLIAVWDGDPARGPGGTGDVVHDALERGLPVIVIRPRAETSPKLLGIAGETSFCADSLNFLHMDGTRQQLKGAQVRARADPRE